MPGLQPMYSFSTVRATAKGFLLERFDQDNQVNLLHKKKSQNKGLYFAP